MRDRTRVRTHHWAETQHDTDLEPRRHPRFVRLGNLLCLVSAAITIGALTWAWGAFVAYMVAP
jgi:hypothetical protein